jgi:hypothetical protein
MRHLSIVIIFGALLLQACDRRKETEVSKNTQVVPPQEEIAREEVTVVEPTPAPIAEPQAAAPVVVPIVNKKEVKKAEPVDQVTETEADTFIEEEPMYVEEAPVIYEDEILIQAEEERWPKNRGKTYNELQLSDDYDDYPFTPSTDDYNFNDRQYE